MLERVAGCLESLRQDALAFDEQVLDELAAVPGPQWQQRRRDHGRTPKHAAELVHQGQAVLNYGGKIDHFIHSTFNVPTQSEAYKYAAYDGLQRLTAG